VKRVGWAALLLLGGCIVSPPPPYGAPGAAYPSPGYGSSYLAPETATPMSLAPLGQAMTVPPPAPVEAAPLAPPAPFTDLPPTGDVPPVADIPPEASPPASDDSLADTIARLRSNQGGPAGDLSPQPGSVPESAQTPDPTVGQQATPVSIPSPTGPPPAADATAAPKLDMTRPGYRDHYGGLNSDGDVPPH
jgi:hypothetical protein